MKAEKLKIGQRWVLGPYQGHDQYLLAEITSIMDPTYCYLRILYFFPNVVGVSWKVGLELNEHPFDLYYWNYLEGQDAP